MENVQDSTRPTARSVRAGIQPVNIAGGPVVFRQSDDEDIMMAAAQAAAVVDATNKVQALVHDAYDQLTTILTQIAAWADEQPTVLRAVMKRVNYSPEFVIEFETAGEWHDEELDDPMSELDLRLADEFPQFHLMLRSVPARFRTEDSGSWNGIDAKVIYPKTVDACKGGV